MYAIVKTGGKQYRVEEGQSLLVERLPGDDGAKIPLRPLLYVDGNTVVDGDELAKVSIEARVLSQERGPKLRIVKFKPKRGYKRRTGHRQELTRIEVTGIKLGARKAAASKQTPTPVAAEASAGPSAGGETAASAGAETAEKPARSRAKPAAGAAKPAARAAKPAGTAAKPAAGAAKKPSAGAAKPAAGAAKKPSAGAAKKPSAGAAKPAAAGPQGAAKPAAAKKPARTRSKPAPPESTPEDGNGA
jgi:large subunit ribosomal protein L21